METLTETPFFLLLADQNGKTIASETELTSVYKEFIRSVVRLCTAGVGECPAFFTLNYTRFELEQLQLKNAANGTGGKCTNRVIPA